MIRSAVRRMALPLIAAAALALPGAALAAQSGGAGPVAWLQTYLSFDTSNPPGDELPAVEYLASLIRRHDPEGEVEIRILTSPGGRANLYARLPAHPEVRTGGSLVLLHHVDVVPAGAGWTRTPFGGALHQHRVWGRGALDVKSLGIAHLGAMLDLLASGAPRRRDLVFLAVADEEAGGVEGVGWLLDAHRDLFDDVDAVLGEAGVNRMVGDRLLWWGIETSQKQVLWLRLTVAGRGGHGSGFNPASPTHRLLRSLNRVLDMEHRWRVTDGAHQSYRGLSAFHSDEFAEVFDQPMDRVQAELDRRLQVGGLDRILLPGMSASFRDTLQVTRIDNGDAPVNVAPSEAVALLDARLLQDTDAEAFRRRVETVLGTGVHVEELLRSEPSPTSSVDGEVWRTLVRVLEVRAPVAPAMIGGATDSRFFRRLGIDAYGFSPFAISGGDGAGIHGVDERIPVDDFLRGCRMMSRVVAALALGGGESR